MMLWITGIALLASFGAAQTSMQQVPQQQSRAVALPNGQFETPRQQGEGETRQVGGIVGGQLIMDIKRSKLGVLRCPAGEAIVAMRHRHGSALDYLQIGCAPVQCNNGQCRWSQASWGSYVGSLGGGIVTIKQSCPADSAVIGYRAATNFLGAYAYDFQIECGKMLRLPNAYIDGVTAVAVADTNRTYANRLDDTTGRTIGFDQSSIDSSCSTSSATAVSYAEGRYGVQLIPVVQAVSFYCLGGTIDDELLQLADQLKTGMNQLKLMAEVSNDHFWFGAQEAVIGTLQFLAQPRGGWDQFGQPAQQLFRFFDPAQVGGNLLAVATQQVDLFLSDPARFFGQLAPGAAAGEGVQFVKQTAKDLIALNGVGSQLGKMEFHMGPVNPAGSTKNCFPCTLSMDRLLAKGGLIPAAAPTNSITPWLTVAQSLREAYGGLGLNPGVPGTWGGRIGTIAQRLGIPVRTNEQGIVSALQAGGPGARGIVFTVDLGGAHAYNVYKLADGTVKWWDPQWWRPENGAKATVVLFYRTN